MSDFTNFDSSIQVSDNNIMDSMDCLGHWNYGLLIKITISKNIMLFYKNTTLKIELYITVILLLNIIIYISRKMKLSMKIVDCGNQKGEKKSPYIQLQETSLSNAVIHTDSIFVCSWRNWSLRSPSSDYLKKK